MIAILRIGDIRIALPLDVLQEVAPAPPTLDPWPYALGPVRGAMTLRGLVLAVVDLAQVLGGRPESTERVVAIVRHGEGVFGMLADKVEAIDRIPAEAFTAYAADEANSRPPGIATHGVRWKDMIIHVLSPASIASLEGVRLAIRHNGDAESQDDMDAGLAESVLLFETGGFQFAVPAAAVDSLLPSDRMEEAPVRDSLLVGLLRQPGRDIPVLDTVTSSRLKGGDGRKAPTCVVVLRLPMGGLVALSIDRVVRMDRLGSSRRAPIAPEVLPPGAPLCDVLLTEDGGQYLAIDLAALAALPGVGCAAPSDAKAAELMALETDPASCLPREAFLLFQAGGVRALPLALSREVIALPPHIIPTSGQSPALVGMFGHRGRHVALLDLDPGMEKVGAGGMVILIEGRDEGYLAREVYAIAKARRHAVGLPRSGGRRDGSSDADDVINVTIRGEALTVPVLVP